MTVSTLNLSQTTLLDAWPEFAARLEAAHARLQQELEDCWREVQNVLDAPQPTMPNEAPAVSTELTALQAARAEAANRLLHEPLAQWERRRPYQRALLAFESYDHALAEYVRALPAAVEVTGAQVLEVVQGWRPTTLARRLTWRRRKEESLALAQSLRAELPALAALRAPREGRLLAALARGIQQLRRNWECARVTLDSAVSGEANAEQITNWRAAEQKRWAVIQKETEAALAEWRAWPTELQRHLANRLLQAVVWRRQYNNDKAERLRAAYVTHWAEQEKNLATELRLEATLEQSERRLLDEAARTLTSLQDEFTRLVAERDRFIAWLRERQSGVPANPMPQPRVVVAPATGRLADFTRGLQQTLNDLPAQVALRARYTAAPARWRRWRQPDELHPRAIFAAAFKRSGEAGWARLLAEIENHHQQIVREIEHARDVVAFGLNNRADQHDARVADEALQNAVSLLEFQRAEMRDWQPEANAQAAQLLASAFNENHLVIGRNRLGAFAHIGQQGVRRGGAMALRALLAQTRTALRRGLAHVQRLVESALIAIGWVQAPSAAVGQVVRRPWLPLEFTADLSFKELPAIYRRLFRPDAVQDPQFLVGREREMEALGEARALWDAGRPVAVLLIGERGSGKTSLLNCALARPLAGLTITRGEFKERMTTAAAVRQSLADMLALPDATALETALSEQRRVIIFEELERAFLRQVGHYEAVRELQRLIAASCKTTLWIVVTNQTAFRLLDAALELGQSFSHRLNAASASREVLREAILLRHKLSGLRLQFGAAARGDRLSEWLRRLRGVVEPEQEFFDKLARESAGVFRTAFEIWLGQIEAVRGGALMMKPLVTPDLTPVINDLDQQDLFTLVAVMQHGSLTPADFAAVFQKSPAASRAQLDELLAREIIEPDPRHPGFRVRPEALRVVQEALYRRNLL